jgi:hypothetical protein
LARACLLGRAPLRMGVAAVVGALGVLMGFLSFVSVIAPDPQAAALYRIVPIIGSANAITNLAGIALSGFLLHAVWLLYTGREGAEGRIERIAKLMVVVVALWFVVVFFAALFPPNGRLRAAERLSVIGGSVMAGLFSALPAVLLVALFRRGSATVEQR